jgi:hypothetical protein
MEYGLQLEEKQRYWLLVTGIAFFTFLIFISYFLLRLQGLLMSTAFICSLLLTPLLYKKYKFFFVLWLFIVPFFEASTFKIIAGTDPINFIAAGLTVPFTLLLFYRNIGQILKDLPFFAYFIFFDTLLFLNIFRPGTFAPTLIDFMKYFFVIFIVFCIYNYVKKHSPNFIFNIINIFFACDFLVAIYQRLSGNMSIVEGIPRVSGLAIHPNGLAFSINIYLPIAFFLFLTSKSKKMKIFLGTNIFIGLIALVFTFCKVAFLILALNIFIILFYTPLKLKVKVFMGFFILTLLFFTVDTLLNLNFLNYFTSRMNNTSSWEWRLKIWNLLLNDINFKTLLIGNGALSANNLLFEIQKKARYAHNVYIQFFHDYGILSISLFLAYLIPGITFLKSLLSKTISNRFIYIIPLLIVLDNFINMFTDNGAMIRTPLYTSWVVITIFYLNLKYNILKNQNLFRF